MTVQKLQNAYYVTSDMARAVGFYRDALGLDLVFQDGDKWTQFKAGGVNFAMAAYDEASDGAVGATIVFEVDDIDAMTPSLKGAGAQILDTRDMGDHGRTLSFRDPDGNLVQLYQRST